jgi:hypothetical protein
MVPEFVTDRLKARVRSDFPHDFGEVERDLGTANCGNQDRERILAAVVIKAHGDRKRLQYEIKLSTLDWRDVLMGSGLEDSDWADRLDLLLGPKA